MSNRDNEFPIGTRVSGYLPNDERFVATVVGQSPAGHKVEFDDGSTKYVAWWRMSRVVEEEA